MSDRHAQRRDRMVEALAAEGVDGWLVSSAVNVSYLTGFTGEASSLVLTRDRALIVSDGRFTAQLQRDCPDVEAHIRPVAQSHNAAIAEVVGRLGLSRLAFEASAVSVADHMQLRDALPTIRLSGVIGAVEALRMIKDDAEIAAIGEAIAVAERAFERRLAEFHPDRTEKEVADDFEAELRRCGATAAAFPPIVAVGPNAALPHHHGSAETRLGDADFVLVDWGAVARSYRSDLTRVVVTGNVSPKFAEVYRTVLTAQTRAIAAVGPGVKACDVDAAARTSIEGAGLGEFFTHGLGHGLGLNVHEAPALRKSSEDLLRPGMVVTIEPGVYLPGWGGIRIEDDVLVTPDGRQVLSRLPKALDSIRL